jgi:hypothetical protein
MLNQRYTRSHENKLLILLLFVDDILLTGDQEAIEEFVRECCNEFSTRDIETPGLFLGIHLELSLDTSELPPQ